MKSGLPGNPARPLPRSVGPRLVRNLRLLTQAVTQHLRDDPALLMIQASRRLPFAARVRIGRLLESSGSVTPAIGALGSVMAGRVGAAEKTLARSTSSPHRLTTRVAGEVAILLDRMDLVPPGTSATTRARAAWSRGELGEAVHILEASDAHDSRYARRLRSEVKLLQPGSRLPTEGLRPHDARGASLAGEGPVRVLHLLTNSLPHTQSGYSLRSHRILVALRGQGIESVALTRTGYPVMVGVLGAHDEDVVDGIRYVRSLPSRLPQTQQERLEAEVDRALQLVDEFCPHIIHATTNYQNALVAQAVAEVTGLPWLFEVRGLMEKTWVASHATEEGREVAALSEKHQLIAAKEGEQARDADAVVTLSETMAEELVMRGVDRTSITLIPNGVDDSLFEDHVSTAEAREIVGLREIPGFGADAFLVGAVSALVEYEGFDVLLRAVAHLLQEEGTPERLRRHLRVVLAGDGVSRPGLVDLAAELGISDRVHLPGRIPRAEARRWVEALDVVVVPRRDVAVARAVTPQKPIEAMALNRPLIVSDLPALREAVPASLDGSFAQRVPAGDHRALAAAIRSAGAAPPSLDSGREKATTVARMRLWPEQVRRYGVVYADMMDRSGGGESNGS